MTLEEGNGLLEASRRCLDKSLKQMNGKKIWKSCIEQSEVLLVKGGSRYNSDAPLHPDLEPEHFC